MRDFLELIWRNKMFGDEQLRLADGTPIEVISSGEPRAAGLFAHCAIHLVGTDVTIYGTVKVDQCSSHYRRDQYDPSLDNVILHFVGEHDMKIIVQDNPLSTLIAPINAELYKSYQQTALYCHDFFDNADPLLRESILSSLLSERLERKCVEVQQILASVGGDWHQTTYIMLLRSFGMGAKKQSFETLARSIPYYVLFNNADNIDTLEALLLGQGGYLFDLSVPADSYTVHLQDVFKAMRAKYNLTWPYISWRGQRQRPQSMPVQQLVRVAAILARERSLLDSLLNAKNVYELRAIFDLPVSSYWQQHVAPSQTSSVASWGISREKIDLLIVNLVIPLLFAYGKALLQSDICERAVELYHDIVPEDNKYTRQWSIDVRSLGDAYYSQAFIQLGAEYCAKGLCSRCPIGAHYILKIYSQA